MTHFEAKDLPISGLKLIQPLYVDDERGYFLKGYEESIFTSIGVPFEITEDFESFSKKGVVRGLHFQTSNPQTKLVRVLMGGIYDVAVDLRMGSPTFGRWHAEYLSSDNHAGFYIPSGFAHGFVVLTDSALVQYKCERPYDANTDTGIVWNDSELAIEWPFVEQLIISKKDAGLQTFSKFKETSGGICF